MKSCVINQVSNFDYDIEKDINTICQKTVESIKEGKITLSVPFLENTKKLQGVK